MVSLSSVFPKESINQQIKAGAVVKMFCDFTTPPKYKYLMIACVSPELLVFVINSEIDPFIRKNPDLLADQVDIPQADHLFLEHDSILNCIQAHQEIDLTYLHHSISLNYDEVYQGHIASYCLRNVLDVVENSKNLTKKVKEQIISAIKQDNGDL